MRPVDRLVAAYLIFTTILILLRWQSSSPESFLLLGMHVLVGLLIYLFTKAGEQDNYSTGRVLRELYPLLLLPTLYTELGIFTMQRELSSTFDRDTVIQGWDAAVFGGQISFDWIRNSPSVFWSGVLHLAYLLYYPIVLAGPALLLLRREAGRARNVLFATILAFVVCYVVFALYPVAGPNYSFEQPTGPVRDVWSARLVYGILGTGSSFGTAFPSSHVAAAVAANVLLWREWRALALIILAPTILLVVGTVYCQMHYGIDATTGFAIGAAAGWVGLSVARRQEVARI
jgi:membrane-associated phospholipid phosphatase